MDCFASVWVELQRKGFFLIHCGEPQMKDWRVGKAWNIAHSFLQRKMTSNKEMCKKDQEILKGTLR